MSHALNSIKILLDIFVLIYFRCLKSGAPHPKNVLFTPMKIFYFKISFYFTSKA